MGEKSQKVKQPDQVQAVRPVAPEMPENFSKKHAQPPVQAQPSTQWGTSAAPGAGEKVQHFEAQAQPQQPQPRPQQPVPGAQMYGQVQPGLFTNLYSDSGSTICMILKMISYIMFALAPISFIRSLLSLASVSSQGVQGNQVYVYILDGIIGAVGYVIAAFLVIAVIKILQNLMAIPKR